MLVREEWISSHRRVVIVEEGDRRVYSIDFYQRIGSLPPGSTRLAAAGEKMLYSLQLGEKCRAIIVETPAGLELISLRLYTDITSDIAGGDAVKAAEICEGEYREWLGSALS